MPAPPQPPPLPPPPPPPPVNPARTSQPMAPAQSPGGLPTMGTDVYTRRGRGRSALTIPLEGAGTGGLNIPPG